MRLFDEVQFGSVTLKNRLAVAPMGTVKADDGGVSPQQFHYLVERAKGGFGLIYPAALLTSNRYEGPYAGGSLTNVSHMMRLKELVDEIHRYGAKVAVQLSPGFGRVQMAFTPDATFVSASDNTAFWNPAVTCKALTVEEIHGLLDDTRNSAMLAKLAGVDIIEIHAYGGYLLDQFLSKMWNRRTDEYGGCLENRMRFLMEFIQAVREMVGPDFPLSIKYTPEHGVPGGRTLDDEGIEIAKILDKMGFVFMHVDRGCYEVWNNAIPSEYDPAGGQLYLSERLRAEGIQTPLMVQGKLNNPLLAEEVVSSGTADMIALGHQSLADPYWPKKVKSGRFQDINYCLACNECISTGIYAVNPRNYHEKDYTLGTPKKLRKLLVVGGGPGGMYTAALAAKQGHDVTLWEKGIRLGGLANAAAGPDFKIDMKRYIDHLIADVYQSGVKVQFLREATPESIDAFEPDAVVIAAGAEAAVPPIPGIDGENVLTAEQLLAQRAPVGKNVVVLGGGVVGCEAALHLDRLDKHVTVVEMLEKILMIGEMAANSRIGLNTALAQSAIEMRTSTKVTEILPDRIKVEGPDGQAEILCDNVILAIGYRSKHELSNALKNKPYHVFTIGDYNKPGKVAAAVHEGFHVVRLLDDILEG